MLFTGPNDAASHVAYIKKDLGDLRRPGVTLSEDCDEDAAASEESAKGKGAPSQSHSQSLSHSLSRDRSAGGQRGVLSRKKVELIEAKNAVLAERKLVVASPQSIAPLKSPVPIEGMLSYCSRVLW